jgi:hypothetical protein
MARLILDPAHAELVRSHIRAGDVIGNVSDRPGERAYHLLLSLRRHSWIAEDHRFAATMRETGGGVLPGHGAGEAKAFLSGDVGRHPDAADRRTACRIVDHDDPLEAHVRPMDMDDPSWTEFIRKSKDILHGALLDSRRQLQVGHGGREKTCSLAAGDGAVIEAE